MLKAHRAVRTMRVLIVEADAARREALLARVQREGFEQARCSISCEDALAFLRRSQAAREPVDVVCLHVPVPDREPVRAFEELRAISDVSMLVITGPGDGVLAEQMLERGADDVLTDPGDFELLGLKIERLLVRRLLQRELRRTTTRNETLFLNVLAVMAKVAEAKDPCARHHSENVSALAAGAARELGLDDEEVRRIGIAGILHDIGKMAISEAILIKPGPLTPVEREIVQRHPVVAAIILEPIEQLQEALGYIRHHHEHYDGNGYPAGLRGQEIPLGARIIHAAEAFDAMSSARPYSRARGIAEVLGEMRSLAGRQFDPMVVTALVEAIARRGLTWAREPEPSDRSFSMMLLDLTKRTAAKAPPPKPSGE